jgi:hypothetical protein
MSKTLVSPIIIKTLTVSGFLASCLLASSGAQAVSIINTAPTWNGSSFIFPWGVSDTSTYGQTFTVNGSDNVLQSFSFQIGQANTPINYAAYVAQWTGGINGSIVGSLLYSSSTQSYSNSNPTFQQVTINTGGIQLNTGSKYVAFLSTSGLQSGQPASTTTFGWSDLGVYTDGEFVFYNTGNNFAPLLNSNWETFLSGDLAFQANLTATAVPYEFETATGLLLFGGYFVGKRYLKKRKSAK